MPFARRRSRRKSAGKRSFAVVMPLSVRDSAATFGGGAFAARGRSRRSGFGAGSGGRSAVASDVRLVVLDYDFDLERWRGSVASVGSAHDDDEAFAAFGARV